MDDQTRDQRRHAARSWIDEKWTRSKACPICGNSDWAVYTAYELREYEEGDFVLGVGNQIVPVIPVSCTQCGYTHLFNAFVAGAISRDQSTASPPVPDLEEEGDS